MNKRLFLWLGGGVIVIFVLFFLWTKLVGPIFTKADRLTEQEAAAIAEGRYAGKTIRISEENEVYMVELERDTGLYEVMINGETGKVMSLEKVSENDEARTTVDEGPDESLTQEKDHEAEGSRRLTEEEAVAIALGVVNGTIDDVDIENINGIAYYFIEVETADGRDANVEINAITGEVRSLTWDD